MSKYILEFEKPIKILEDKILKLKSTASSTGLDNSDLINNLEADLNREINNIYSNLSRWQKVEIARHPLRPHTTDYIKNILTDWIEIHGDRKFADDKSIIAGFGKINNIKVALIGQEKGRNTKQKVFRNFGMPKPEGYRKALRVMKLAEKFNLPIITFIDTPGAYPGIGAEERGQAQAIADNLIEMSSLNVPIVSIVIGEGASGGALAIGLADKIICLENSWYSVISPEGCASILFGDTNKNIEAAESLKVTSNDAFEMNIADKIIEEPIGGIHHDPNIVYDKIIESVTQEIVELSKISKKQLLDKRMAKYNRMGMFIDE